MIPILTVEQMRNLDQDTICGDQDISYEYMRRAAHGLFEAISELLPNRHFGDIQISENILIVCGKGNNGGDGYLLAKYLLEAGYRVKCFSLARVEEIKTEAKKAYEEYLEVGGSWTLVQTVADMEDFTEQVDSSSVIVDALFGTGVTRAPEGLYADLIKIINDARATILAVDTPSGMDNNNGSVADCCIKANMTVSMGYPKLGSFFYPARANVGSLLIKDLDYPQNLLEKNSSDIFFMTNEEVKAMLPSRKIDGSKFDHGLTLMICGSRSMTGAAVLSSMSALRSGAGMVFLAAPSSSVPIIANHLIEVVLHGINESSEGNPSIGAAHQCLELAERVDALCIGPGISHKEETIGLVKELVSKLDKPIVLDADGINAYKDCLEELKVHKSEMVLTPHAGEFERLFAKLPDNPIAKIDMLKSYAREYNITILLKGMPTIVVDPHGRAYILPYGNSGMATAGSGDVLSGIITSFIAQGKSTTEAAILGAFVHGDAGNKAKDKYGEYSMIASDILEKLPLAISVLASQVK